jgi:hypothetical protein
LWAPVLVSADQCYGRSGCSTRRCAARRAIPCPPIHHNDLSRGSCSRIPLLLPTSSPSCGIRRVRRSKRRAALISPNPSVSARIHPLLQVSPDSRSGTPISTTTALSAHSPARSSGIRRSDRPNRSQVSISTSIAPASVDSLPPCSSIPRPRICHGPACPPCCERERRDYAPYHAESIFARSSDLGRSHTV